MGHTAKLASQSVLPRHENFLEDQSKANSPTQSSYPGGLLSPYFQQTSANVNDKMGATFVDAIGFERLEYIESLLPKLRHHTLREKPDILHCHFLRHATEIKGSGDRR